MEKKTLKEADKKSIHWLFRWVFSDPRITNKHVEAFEKAWGPIHGRKAIFTLLFIQLTAFIPPLGIALIGYPQLFVLFAFLGAGYWVAVVIYELMKAAREWGTD